MNDVEKTPNRMTRPPRLPSAARAAAKLRPALALLPLLLGACSFFDAPVVQRGNRITGDQLREITPGVQTKNDVRTVLGSPTQTGMFGDDEWYYISSSTRQRLRLAEAVGLMRDEVRDPADTHIGETRGLTLSIITSTINSYPPHGPVRVRHLFAVPAATYNRASWQRWLFQRFLDVERHECMEFFTVDGDKPYAPNHGPGWDPYLITTVEATDVDRRTSFRGDVKAVDTRPPRPEGPPPGSPNPPRPPHDRPFA